MSIKTKPTLAALIESTNIPAALVRAVVRQIGGWQSFTESAPDITAHGIDGGFSGFIYNADTEAFAKRHREHIAAMAEAQASDMGTSVTEMIQGFGCFRNGTKPTDCEIGLALYAGKEKEDSAPVLNALAWYAGEEVSRAYNDLLEQRAEAVTLPPKPTPDNTPKTGARCSCRPGVQRDNCAACEGTGMVIDFAAIRARRS